MSHDHDTEHPYDPREEPRYVAYAAAALTGILANPETADDIDIVCHTAHQFAEGMVRPAKVCGTLDTGAMHGILSTTQSNANQEAIE